MATFTLGWASVFLVAAFAKFVENFFCFGGFRFCIVTATAGTSFNAFVMAGGAVSDTTLVRGMLKSYLAHAGFKFDFSWAFVAGNS